MNKNKEFLSYWQEEITIEQFRRYSGPNTSNRPFKKQVRDHIRKEKYKNLLDAGAGLFSEYYGFKKDGYDIDYTAAEITHAFVKEGKENNIKVVECNIDNMPFENEVFDCCICHDVLNHQLDYRQQIEEMLRITRKEVIISFFKPFEEEASESHYSGLYPVEKTSLGLVEHRGQKNMIRDHIFEKKTTYIYSYFNRKKMIKFLDSLKNIHYVFSKTPDLKIMLSIVKTGK